MFFGVFLMLAGITVGGVVAPTGRPLLGLALFLAGALIVWLKLRGQR